jgi:amino acid adenylation domain-containing protein
MSGQWVFFTLAESLMSTAAELLATLRQKDVKLWLDGDRLRYRAAKDTLSPELLAQLKIQKAEIIDFLKSIGAGSNSPIPPLISGDRTGHLPLSFGQQRLWFLHQFEPSSSANNVPVVVRFKGNLNVLALEQSLNTVVRRHEVLRTTFPTIDGQPIQAIATDFTLTLPIVDLHQVPADLREAEALRLATAEAHQPFDLAQGPNLRVLLLQLDPIEHLLIWNMNSIICDGASSDLFYQETIACYRAFSTGQTPALTPLSIQYADFAQWQRNWLQGEVLTKQVDYWKQKLGGNLPTIQLPFDRPRPVGVPTYRGDRAARMLPKELENSLNKLSQSWGGTLFMTLLTAFNVLLYRYSGQEDLLVSFASTGRGQVELERSIGFFSNTLLLRTKLEDNPTFRELADRVKLDCVEAYSHQDVPFEKLVEELPSEQRSDRSPLFQVKFALNPPWSNGRGMAAVELPDLTITSLFGYIYHGQTKYDLILVMREQDEGLGMVFDYNADMFEASTIDRMLGHFQTLLEGIVANPAQQISQLPLLTKSEQQQILWDWNDTQTEYPRDKCVHQLFEAQAATTPDAVAVACGERQLTYRQLDCQANQLARYLIESKVGAEVLVGICIERSLEMMVGLLGILKAGGAYVPLDPSYPQERLDYTIADAAVSVILTKQSLLNKLPDYAGQVICLDTDWGEIDRFSPDRLDCEVSTANLAYIIYTSGSTGKPKGVMIPHQGLVNYLSWCIKAYNVKTGAGSTVNSSISFDATITSLFSPLLVGRRVLLLPEQEEIEALKAAVCSGVEFNPIKITPAHLEILGHLLVDRVEINCRTFVIGGEALSAKIATFWQEHAPATKLINEYGPTETVVGCCTYEVDDRNSTRWDIPIGRPIANTQLYILDRQLQPVPIGIAGELYIGGDGLARGYLNQPQLTESRFIANPFDPARSPRLYKTGDLARYLSDGNIDFLGRIDRQVKIRGFRIELGEIEAALCEHPQLRQTTVVVQENSGSKRLIAYYVPNDKALDSPPTVGELSDFISSKVPNYMVPSMFVMLPGLPMTANGKIDRRALPEPDYLRLQPEMTFIAPRNELEIQLTKIWRKVLGIPSIGIRDNFFELGGHSLIAVRLFAEIEQTWGRNLPLATLFQAQTIEKMADLLLEQAWVAPWSSLVPIQPNGSKPPLFCIHPIGGNILEYYPFANYLDRQQPVYGLQSLGLDGRQPPLKLVEDMASHYIKEMLTVQPQGPYFILGYSFGGLVAFEIAQQLSAQSKEIGLLAILDLKSPNLPKVRPSFAKSVKIHWENLGQLPAKEKIKYIRDRIDYRLNSNFDYKEFLIESLAEVDTPILKSIDIIDANLQSIQDYTIRPYSGDLSLFRCQVQTLDYALSPDLGWGELVDGNLEIYHIDSIHYGMLREPSVRVVAEKFQHCLQQAQSQIKS